MECKTLVLSEWKAKAFLYERKNVAEVLRLPYQYLNLTLALSLKRRGGRA